MCAVRVCVCVCVCVLSVCLSVSQSVCLFVGVPAAFLFITTRAHSHYGMFVKVDCAWTLFGNRAMFPGVGD